MPQSFGASGSSSSFNFPRGQSLGLPAFLENKVLELPEAWKECGTLIGVFFWVKTEPLQSLPYPIILIRGRGIIVMLTMRLCSAAPPRATADSQRAALH